MIPFSLIANLSMMGEWNFSVPLLSQSNFFGVWFWQLISVALAIGIGFIFLFGKKQRKNMREFMERRTETILDQKTKIEEQNSLLEVEHKKSDELLQDIFPKKIIKILKNKGSLTPDYYKEATILFADVVSFSKITPNIGAEELVDKLTIYFRAFDKIITENKMILIKTIGDCYFAVGGVPKKSFKSPILSVLSSLQMQEAVSMINYIDESGWKIRIGLNTGEIVAGVLDTKRPMFDVWGSSVNVASRIQESGFPGKVNISEATYLKIYPYFDCEERGEINTKNVGNIPMYFVDRIKPELSANAEGTEPNKIFWQYANNLKSIKQDYVRMTRDVIKLLKDKLPEGIFYHTENHALNIMNAVEFIGFGEEIYTEDILLLKTAALFHDVGFIEKYYDNEIIGVKYAREMMPNYGFNMDQINKVEALILATDINREPKNLLEEIIKDADLDYLGRGDFKDISEKLKKEYLINGIVSSEKEFHEKQVSFLKTHMFYTDTAKTSRIEKKKENIKIAEILNNS
ncbi:hypothetical protein N8289_01500 [Flavobacteriales bacterium]|nr:hypothetical protein [Flavobacteriales bacterium]